jgi:hypothetical protein
MALPVLSVFAQAKPDFSGTWKLNVAKSDFGPLPAPESRTDVVTHKEPSLSDTVTAEGSLGKMQYTANYTTDGKEAVNKISELDMKSTLKWAGSSLVISSKFVYNGSDVASEATWTLSSDGKTLNINVHFTSSLGEADQKLVYDKQESAPAPAQPKPAKATP